jgi:hypothetical protein
MELLTELIELAVVEADVVAADMPLRELPPVPEHMPSVSPCFSWAFQAVAAIVIVLPLWQTVTFFMAFSRALEFVRERTSRRHLPWLAPRLPLQATPTLRMCFATFFITTLRDPAVVLSIEAALRAFSYMRCMRGTGAAMATLAIVESMTAAAAATESERLIMENKGKLTTPKSIAPASAPRH